MKTVHVITELAPGGAEKVVSVLVRESVSRGCEVTVVSLKKAPENAAITSLITSYGGKIVFLDGGKSSPFSLLARLRRTLLAEKPSVVHSHLMHPNVLSRLALAFTSIPLVNTIHIAERRRGKCLWFLLDRLTFSLADAVTAVSDAAAVFHGKKCSIKAGRIETVMNSTEKSSPFPDAFLEKFRKDHGLDGCSKIIGSFGRLDFQKGYDVFLSKVLTELEKMVPDGEKFGIVITGDGPEKETLEALAGKFASSPKLKVVLPGFVKDAAGLCPLFDVFVMPSRYEGYGLALAEAMTFGLPCVCSKADSLPELCTKYVSSGGSALTVDADENGGKAFAAAIVKSSSLPRSQGVVLRTDKEMADDYFAVYSRIMEKRSR